MAGVINTTYTFTATDLVTSAKLNNLVDETIFTNDAITGTTLEVTGTGKLRVRTGGIASNEILDANVTTVKIADANVTTAKITDGNVTTAKITDGNVTTAKIADANVTTAKIADANVTTAKIADANVTTAKIAAYGPNWSSTTMNVGAYTAATTYFFSLAAARTGDGAVQLSFGAETGVSTSATIVRASGTNGTLTITNAGTGTVNFVMNGTNRFYIGTTLAEFSVNVAAPNFLYTSDYRLKTDVADLGDPLDQVLALRPVSYTMRDERRLGLIAHEVQEIFPEAVRGEKDAVDAEGAPVYQSIEYTALIPVLIAAIKNQQRQIDELRDMK